MKKNIRNGVFETNSSSTHSFSYSDSYDKDRIGDLEKEIVNGKIKGYFYELGWECNDFSSPACMLGIILTHIVSRDYDKLDFQSYGYNATKKKEEEINKHNIEQLLKNKFFILFKEAIKELTGAELIIDIESLEDSSHPFGYVDHQSNDQLDEVFEGTEEEVKEEMKKALLTGYYETDNDNY